MRKFFNIVTTVILVFLIGIVIFIFIVRLNGSTPNLFGYQIYRVSSDSMTPSLEVGEVILVKECSPEDIQKGDIITYDGTSGAMAGKVITHRVAEEPVKIGDTYYYQTKGDREGASPDPQISFLQVKGKYIRSLPLIEKLYSFFLTPYGIIVFILVIIVLFGYEMISLIVSYKAVDEKDDDYYAPPNRKPSKKRVKNKKTNQKTKVKKTSE